jgi:hypothetical protein
MPYIGNTPALDYISYAVQNFTVTAGTTSYALDYSVANENDIRLVINNVIQRPGASFAYSATGTTLTLTSATLATDTMYAVFIGRAVQTVTPPANSITNTMLNSSAITGQTAETSVAGGDQILIYDDSVSALRKMTIANLGNTPAFSVYRNTTQSLSDNVATKVQFNTEVFDTDNAFDSTTNYRFTVPSGKGGKYFISLSIGGKSTTGIDQFFTKLYKNGSLLYQNYIDVGPTTTEFTAVVSVIVELAATDFVEGFIQLDGEPAGTYTVSDTARQTNFNGFRLIGV